MMTKHTRENQQGFTLAEILVALAITGIVTAAIFGTYISNAKTHAVQTQVIDMQQNLRTGLELLRNDLKMAGYDPSRTGNFGFQPGEENTIVFTLDLNGNGVLEDTAGEYVTYSLYEPAKGWRNLGRKSTATGNNQPVVENIEALGFAYAFDANGDGELDNDGGHIHWAIIKSDGGTDTWFDLDADGDGEITEEDGAGEVINGTKIITTDPADVADIRAIRVWMLARTGEEDRGYRNRQTYIVGNRVKTYDDHYRRRLLSTIVKCRNLGL